MKVKKLLALVVATLCAAGAWADTDVTTNYVGDVTYIIGSHTWAGSCTTSHALSAGTGAGYYNTQTIVDQHTFYSKTDNVSNGVESWSNTADGEGYMLARMMVLPEGRYTLTFTAMANNITNTVVKCGDVEQSFNAAEVYETHTFELDVTTANTMYEFGIYQKDGGTANWAVMGAISLTLKSTTITPVTNGSNEGWTTGLASNTHSTEGNQDGTYFMQPFMQAWVWRDNALSDGSYSNSYTPSENGFYRLNAWVRLYNEKAGLDTFSGATMFAGSNFVSVCTGGTAYNSKKVYLGTYSTKIDATKDVAFNYGFTLASANFNWLAFKNVTIEKVTLEEYAETFSSGSAVTEGMWYKFTTGSTSDAYTLSSDGTATITYTTDGTLSDDADISTTWALHAKQNVLLAPNTTYYIKSSAAVTLTKSETSVNSSYVSGWTKVTSISDLQDSPKDYFFAIFSANNTGLMLEANTSNGSSKLYYKTAANPLSSSAYLFELENYEEGFALKSVGIDKYFKSTSGAAWNYEANESSAVSDCETTIALANGVYTLRGKNNQSGNDYIGLWHSGASESGYVTGQYLAGNKNEDSKGSFLIYRIAKNDLAFTSLITNPDFEASTWSTGWTGTGSDKKDAFKDQSGNSSFTGTFAEMWVPSGTTMAAGNLYQTINNLPAGVYTLTAKVQAGVTCKLYATVGDADLYTECSSSVRTETLTFTVPTMGNVTIGLKHDGATSPSQDVWVAVDDFALSYEPFATSADYTALNDAITAAEAYTLGFDDDEYAPYNNRTALALLAAARDIDQDADNAQSVVTAATSALTSASWTPNDGEVNAIYDGQFANTAANSTSGDITLPGWTKVDGIRLLVKDAEVDPGLTYTDGGAAVFSWGGTTLTYGAQEGYTLPLNKYEIYQFSVKVAGWRDGDLNSTLTVNLGGVSNSSNLTPGKINQAEGNPFVTVKFLFVPTTDNPTLTIHYGYHFVIADLELKKATIAIDENAASAPTVAGTADVTLTRTFNADAWNTLVLPFDMTLDEAKTAFGSDVVIANYTGTETVGGDEMLKFSTEDASIAANEPVFIWGATGVDGVTVSNRSIEVATPTLQPDGASYSFVGSYAATTTLQTDDYFIGSDNNLYSVGTAKPSMKGTRAFFRPVAAGVKAMGFSIDDETTGILTLDGDGVLGQTGSVYTLAGQRVSKPAKGLYIVNGKKMVIK